MRTAARLTRQLAPPVLLSLGSTGSKGYSDWVRQGNYVVNNVISANSFELLVPNDYDIAPSLAFEISRFAAGSFESLEALSRTCPQPKSTGWLLIGVYYSAFFAAHAILRIFGRFCSQLQPADVGVVSTSAFALGTTPILQPISAGLYVAVYDWNAGALRADRLSESHADTWKSFYDLITYLSTAVLTVTGVSTEKNMAAGTFDELKDGLSRAGGLLKGNWLSLTRNNVNYQFGLGAWFPYSAAAPDHADLLRIIDNWLVDDVTFNLRTKKGSEAIRFCNLAACIVNFCRSLVLELDANRRNKRLFLDNRALAFLRLRNLI